MLVIGHRGALWEAPENSLSSFNKAITIACDRIELDLWGAKDNSLWVCHDENLERTTGTSGLITELTKKELQEVKLLHGEALPDLKTLLRDFLPKIELNIELKDPREEVALALIKKISDHKLNSKIIISSFNIAILKFIEKKAPHLKLALLWEGPISQDSEAISLLDKHPHWIFHPEADTLSFDICSELLRKNKIIYPWVARIGIEEKKREELWQTMLSMKVHGLCTNYPREFKQWISKKSRHPYETQSIS